MPTVSSSPAKGQTKSKKSFSPAVLRLGRQLRKISRPLKPADLEPMIRQLLAEASKGKGRFPQFVTGYQLFRRMPSSLRKRLISASAPPGKGAGKHYSAASIIATTCKRLKNELDQDYLDTRDLVFQTRTIRDALGGSPVCGVYRLRRPRKSP